MPETDAITDQQHTRRQCCSVRTVLSALARAIFAPIVCLVLGIIVSIGIAWSLAMTCGPFSSLVSWDSEIHWLEPQHWRCQTISVFGIQYFHVDPYAPEVYMVPGGHAVTVGDFSINWIGDSMESSDCPWWSMTQDLAARPTIDEVQPIYWREEAFGWPVVCMRQVHYIKLRPYSSHVWQGYPVGERAIPLRPIWRGIIINTLFYAAVLWGMWMMRITLRSASRRRKGLCGGCAYDLRGADHARCPECGNSV